MSDQELSPPATAASLEKLEQRFPILADLLTRRGSRIQSGNSAAGDTSGTKNLDDLSQEERNIVEKSLHSHYDRVAKRLRRLDPNSPV